MCSGMNMASRLVAENKELNPPKKKTNIIITVDRGMVQALYHDNPDIETNVIIADFDLPLADNMYSGSEVETEAGKVVLEDVESFEDSTYVEKMIDQITYE